MTVEGSFKDTVVVITGASSGIGRATAHEFARRGACLVLAARREPMLREVEQECVELGGTAMSVRTDVRHEDEVERLAADAVAQFGRIDVWFNNAGVGVFGRFEDIPTDAWRGVVETNLFGCVFGAKAALQRFRAQGHGVLINNASIAGRFGHPDSAAYATSKFAIRGLSESLRQELLDQRRIHVCTILPSVVDTPFFQHAANFSHRRVRAMPPVCPPDKVALAVLDLVRRPREEVVIGGAGKGMAIFRRVLPEAATRLNGRASHEGFSGTEPSPVTTGSLFDPVEDNAAVEGGWREPQPPQGRLPLVALAAVGLAVGWAAIKGRRRSDASR